MSEWASRIREHRVWGLLQDLGPAIDSAAQLQDIDQSAMEALGRLRTVLAFSGKRVGGSDPLTIVPSTLESLANAIAQQKTEIEAFVTDRDAAHLANANSAADAALLQLAQIPGVATSEELIELMTATSAQRSKIAAVGREWSESRRKAQTDIKELKTTIEAFKTQAQSTIAELQSQLEAEREKIASQAAEQQKLFTAAQESRSTTYNETLQKTQENLTKIISDQQGQFSGAQESRGREFTAAQTEMQKTFGGLIGDYTKRLADQDAEFTKRRDAFALEAEKHVSQLDSNYRIAADKIIEAVNKRREEVETLVGVIGNLGVTSGYQKAAQNAQVSMWIWQGVAVSALVAVIVFAYYAFIPALQGDFRWSGFATRVFLTITVGVLAAYAAKQADRFFHAEKQNRRLALELAAIDPFIALLPLEEQYKFKLEVGRRTFAQEERNGLAPADRSPATALDLFLSKDGQQTLQALAEISSKLPKTPGK